MKIGENFEIERDKVGWVLSEWKDGERVDKETGGIVPTRTRKDTYHGTLDQALRKLVDRNLPDTSAQAILDALNVVHGAILKALEEKGLK